MASQREFDVCVFGASGFTGRFIVEELLTVAPELKCFGTGRSVERTQKLLQEHTPKLAELLAERDFPVFACDAADAAAVADITRRCKVLISAAGPFNRIGMNVARACVQTSTRYVDVTGEPLFVERVYQELHEEAQKHKTTLVNCYGFDCVLIGVMWIGFLIRLAARFAPVAAAVRAAPDLLTLGLFSAHADPKTFRDKWARWDFVLTRKDGSVRRAEISMPDPGYTATSTMAVACALQLHRHGDTLPTGVVTTATAFGKTDILEHLAKRQIVFRYLDSK